MQSWVRGNGSSCLSASHYGELKGRALEVRPELSPARLHPPKYYQRITEQFGLERALKPISFQPPARARTLCTVPACSNPCPASSIPMVGVLVSVHPSGALLAGLWC